MKKRKFIPMTKLIKPTQKTKKMVLTTKKSPKQEVFSAQQKATSRKRSKAEADDFNNGDDMKPSVMEKAEKVQTNLPSEVPSFIKYMHPSIVSGGFWLGLPRKFCAKHLPNSDSTIVLVDRSGTEYKTKYLLRKMGLSGGWRGFSIAHKLLEGDVLVFALVRPAKFMVHILRKDGLDEVCGASLEFMNSGGSVKQEDSASKEDIAGDEDVKRWKKGDECLPNSPQEAHQSENDNGHCPQVLEGIRSPESAVDFKDVRSIKDFSILVNGLAMNSEFSEHLRTKYYELCCSQKTYLHDHLLHGLNSKLAAGIITETVSIADSIRACTDLTTCRDAFSNWSKTLEAFQKLGMKVGFLRARLDQLMSFAFVEKRRREARVERMNAEGRIKDLEGSLLHAKEVKKKLDAEIEALNSPPEDHHVMFKELAKAPW